MKQVLQTNIGPQTAKFYYTIEGRPLNIAFDNLEIIPPYDEGLRHHFDYDEHKRLQAYTIISFANEGTWHSYSYSGDLIAVDTTVTIDFIAQIKSISKLMYDDQKRVIKEDIEVVERDYVPVSEFSTIRYLYDSSGNLIMEGVQYDNKTSFMKTDNIWMFINRNYSKNNPTTAKGYNSNDLPIGFSGQAPRFMGAGAPSEITYECE
jgi:hypothetical protein